MSADLARTVGKLTERLKRRVLLSVGRAVVKIVNDAAATQTVQLLALDGEVLDGVEHLQPYGLTTHPHPGAEAALLAVGGLRAHALTVSVADKRYRLHPLSEGEVAVHDDLGQVVHLTRDGIVISSPKDIFVQADGELSLDSETGISLSAPEINIAADLNATISAGVMARLEGPRARVHGTAEAAIDAGGTGLVFTPPQSVSYTVGAASSAAPIRPPEVP